MAADAEEAMSVAASGDVQFCLFTTLILVFDTDQSRLEESAALVMKTIQNLGFACRIESVNALEAWRGTRSYVTLAVERSRAMEMFERPRGYKGPNLDPTGIPFQPRAFANGVYALLARPWPRDNSGVIAGENATLVIDAGINGRVARR